MTEAPKPAPSNPLINAIRQATGEGYDVIFRPDYDPVGPCVQVIVRRQFGGEIQAGLKVATYAIDASYIPGTHILANVIEKLLTTIHKKENHIA